MLARWHQHFHKLLNIESDLSEEVVESRTVIPAFTEFDTIPSDEELVGAVSKLKNGKAGGKTVFLPELVSGGSAHLLDRQLALMQDMWAEGTVVNDWKDAVDIPIPKKGYPQLCDNWWGISLGKCLCTRTIQE